MKELRVLEILKNALKDEPDDIFEGMEDEEVREYVLDAIRELERLKDILWEKDRKLEELNNRSCKGCICWDSVENSKLKTISYCRFLNTGTKNSFYCNRYEAKGEQVKTIPD